MHLYDPEECPPDCFFDPGQSIVDILYANPPDKTKPCWVLTTDRRGWGSRKTYHRIRLREYLWNGQAWKPTGGEKQVENLNKAFKQAHWWGRLPKQGRERI